MLRRVRLTNCLSFIEVFRYVAFFWVPKKIFSKTRVKLLPFCQNSSRVHKVLVECTEVESLFSVQDRLQFPLLRALQVSCYLSFELFVTWFIAP